MVTSSEANQLYTCSKMQNFAFDDIHHKKISTVHLITVVSSSLLVLNDN